MILYYTTTLGMDYISFLLNFDGKTPVPSLGNLILVEVGAMSCCNIRFIIRLFNKYRNSIFRILLGNDTVKNK